MRQIKMIKTREIKMREKGLSGIVTACMSYSAGTISAALRSLEGVCPTYVDMGCNIIAWTLLYKRKHVRAHA